MSNTPKIESFSIVDIAPVAGTRTGSPPGAGGGQPVHNPIHDHVGVYKPRLAIEFHTPDRMYRAVKEPTDTLDAALKQDLLSANTSKLLRSPAGTFSVNLTGRRGPDGKTWLDRLAAMDLVVISMQRFDPAHPQWDDSKDRCVMVGLIDTVTEAESIGGNNPDHSVTVQGRDFGKIFLKAVQKFFPTDTEAILKKETTLIKQAGPHGSPAYLIAWAITDLIFKDLMALDFKVHGAKGTQNVNLSNIMRFVLAATAEMVPFTTGLFSFEGPVWNWMSGIVNAPFNELFIDTRDDYWESVANVAPVEHHSGEGTYALPDAVSFGTAKVTVIMRPTPFDPSAFKALTGHVIDRYSVLRYSLAKSDNEVFTVFNVNPTIKIPTDTDWKNLVKPLKADSARLKRYGVNVLEVPIRALDTGHDTITNAIDYGRKLQQRLQDWYGANETLESGTITVKGNGKYRIGHRVTLDWRKKDYYVEGVNQNFPLLGQFTTDLTLTRGH